MIKVAVLYPKAPGSRFDHDYYLNVHMPMSISRIGHAMQSISVDRGTGGAPWPEASFHAICNFVCESREAYEAAFFPHMAELQGDIPKFTDVQAIIQLSDVVMDLEP